MTIDLIGWMEALLQSQAFLWLVIAAAASCVWYYVSHGAHTMQNPNARTPEALFKSFVAGQPVMLLVILILVIAVVAAVTQFLGVGLP